MYLYISAASTKHAASRYKAQAAPCSIHSSARSLKKPCLATEGPGPHTHTRTRPWCASMLPSCPAQPTTHSQVITIHAAACNTLGSSGCHSCNAERKPDAVNANMFYAQPKATCRKEPRVMRQGAKQ